MRLTSEHNRTAWSAGYADRSFKSHGFGDVAFFPLIGAFSATVVLVALAYPQYFLPLTAAVFGACLVVLALRVDPSVLCCAAIVLYPISGNWEQLGIPGAVAPNRLLLIAALASALAHGLTFPWRNQPVFWLLVATSVYACASALLAGTITDRTALFNLIETFGLLPFAVFLAAPTMFGTPQRRRTILIAMVGLAAYLSLTTLFEMLHLTSLVYPRYISDPSYGLHFGRGRGPFVEAVTNGVALFGTAVLSLVAGRTFLTRGGRYTANVVGCFALVCTIFTLERGIWVGVVSSIIITMAFYGDARRTVMRALPSLVAATVVAFLIVPNFATQASSRVSDQMPIWDRQNLNRAALNMVEAKPLLGFGWGTFQKASTGFFQQSGTIPLTATSSIVHNLPLSYASALGLFGFGLWLASAATAFIGGLRPRAVTAEMRLWQIALFAYTTMFLIVANFVPPATFPALFFWLLAGIAYRSRMDAPPGRVVTRPDQGFSRR